MTSGISGSAGDEDDEGAGVEEEPTLGGFPGLILVPVNANDRRTSPKHKHGSNPGCDARLLPIL